MKNPLFLDGVGSMRIRRSGSWNDTAWAMQRYYRYRDYASYSDFSRGCRLFRTVKS